MMVKLFKYKLSQLILCFLIIQIENSLQSTTATSRKLLLSFVVSTEALELTT